ncbi:uncharacterized protein LOC134499635 isoform X1 [Candoia aspera]|uniref:uncharacterized protein LOC134499635 isoform X1 n=1 Tax=Candoia aspera TaxID=51853 RepID=UPI002FD82234
MAMEGKVDCKNKVYCETCRIYVVTPHKKCKKATCGQCSEKVESLEGHLCFLKPSACPKIGERYIIYDFECCPEMGVHIPNYVYAMDMLKDGNDKDIVSWDCYGVRCLEQFVKKFMNRKFKGCTFIAHNAKGYDGHLVLMQLILEKVKVELISQGGKLLCNNLPAYKIQFIDSLSFLPLKLSKLPKAMGFQGSKGYFPHLFNTVMRCLPLNNTQTLVRGSGSDLFTAQLQRWKKKAESDRSAPVRGLNTPRRSAPPHSRSRHPPLSNTLPCRWVRGSGIAHHQVFYSSADCCQLGDLRCIGADGLGVLRDPFSYCLLAVSRCGLMATYLAPLHLFPCYCHVCHCADDFSSTALMTNTMANQDYVGPLPDVKYYSPVKEKNP